MRTIRIYILFLFTVLISGSCLLAQPADNPSTFCNPMNLNYRFMVDAVDAREAADPVVVLYQDAYYLFASRSGGYWVSEDFRNWELVVPTGLDVESYAPAIIAMRDSLFYIPSGNGQIFKSGDPGSGVWEKGPNVNAYGDPAFFLDDDDRLYMFFGLAQWGPIQVVELDPVTFERIGSVVEILRAEASVHGWERRGDTNLQDENPWIEGSWMIKENGRYYLHYAGPGTEFKTYADGIYVSDSPTGPFEYATYSPFTFKPTGFICGAGHGSTFKDRHGQYWHIGTMTISIQHMFERRLGVFPVSFDEEGQIRCNTVFGDYPHYFPGEQDNMVEDGFAGMMLLSHKKYVMASSYVKDHSVELAVDEEVRTYWSAQTGNMDEWLMVDLGSLCSVEAVQVNFAEHNTNPDQVRGREVSIYEQYILEHSVNGIDWEVLADKSQNQKDMPHDYIELVQPVNTRYIKCANVFTPGSGYFAIRDLRVFGNSDKVVITPVNDFTVDRDPSDGRDAVIRWSPVENADGYVVRYGIDPDKLYNNYMVYDKDSVSMHSLNHSVDYYFSVEAFDNGTEYYHPAGEFRSSQSGNWHDPDVWAWHNGTDWIIPAPRAPRYQDGLITILDGDTITIADRDTVDQLQIAAGGVLAIDPGINLFVSNGVGPDMQIAGSITNWGSILTDAEAMLNFVDGGVYLHQQDGGTIPSAIWRKGSSCIINGVVNDAPANGNQDFYHITWNCPGQSGNKSMKWNGNTIGGNIVIENTGSGRWQMCAPSSGQQATVHIAGSIIQSGGSFSSNGTSNANTTVMIYQQGDIQVTGGNFSVSRGSQGGSGTTLWNLEGNVTIQDATTQNSNQDGAMFVFKNIHKAQTLSLTNVTYGSGGFPVQVDSGAALDMGESILEGSGRFILKSGAMLITGHEAGVDAPLANTGTKVFESNAGFGFNGKTGQVTGDQIPSEIGDFLINNSQGVNLSKSLTINGQLEIIQGSIKSDAHHIQYGANGSLCYSGESGQTTTDVEFPEVSGPVSLVIANDKSVGLHASRFVHSINLQGGLELQTFTLTADEVLNATSDNYICTEEGGVLRLSSVGSSTVLFPVGTNRYAPVWITNTGEPDTISVSVVKDDDISPEGGRVRLKYDIREAIQGGGDYTVQLGWMSMHASTQFRRDPENSLKIFRLSDMKEVGEGSYAADLESQLMTLARSGITELGPFAIGDFSGMSGIDDALSHEPIVYSLKQNYPNPFNPETKINFSIGRNEVVKVAVYDLLGRQIETLVNTKMEAGSHSLVWDARQQASGIYFVKIITGEFVKTRKMVLLK
ncbi:family 43 glycosylhydrolase [bacterium]|nr:family 43 glycosylhydrolase [bacterium]